MTGTLVLEDGTLAAALVVVSDVHLGHMGDERAVLLLDVLDRLAPSVEYVVLNGDILDFCKGDGNYFREKFRLLGEALARIAARGTRVIFAEGNHEFYMDRMGWDAIQIIKERDYVVTLASGTRIKITHGDLLTDEPLYRLFRGLVKSAVARHVTSLLPGPWFDARCLRHARRSRGRDQYRTLNHERILTAFNAWLSDGRYDHGVIGHFHIPYAEKRQAADGLLLSVESWDRPNLLLYSDAMGGGFQRVFLRGPGAAFQAEGVESIFKPLLPSAAVGSQTGS